jgi:hypothetical protein
VDHQWWSAAAAASRTLTTGNAAIQVSGIVAEAAAAIAAALAAFFTFRMAQATAKMAEQTKRSVNAAERSVHNELESLERQKDQLRPLVSIAVSLSDDLDQRRRKRIAVGLANLGPGAAIVRHITTRDDVSSYDIGRLGDVLVGPARNETVQLSSGTDPQKPGFVSSLSAWYVDVYGRWYRTRYIYVYEQAEQNEVCVKGLLTEVTLIGNMPNMFRDTTVRSSIRPRQRELAEGGRCVRYNKSSVDDYWHLLRAQAIAEEVELSNTPYVGEAQLTLKGIGFWAEGPWPEFHLELQGFAPFILSKVQRGDRPAETYIMVSPGEDYPVSWARQAPVASDTTLKGDMTRFGLRFSNRVDSEADDLYKRIFSAVDETLRGA